MSTREKPDGPATGTTPPRSNDVLFVGVGVPVVAAITLLYGWLIVPMLFLPSMYVMGLGRISIVCACTLSGLTWCAAATTWLRPKSIGIVVVGAAVGAAGFALTGFLRDILGNWAPLCGAIVAASLLSSVLEDPTVRPRLMALGALAGAVAGAIVGSQLPQDSPRAALWIVIIALHGSIAVMTRSRWLRLTGRA